MQTDFPIAEQLLTTAAHWRTYPSTMTRQATDRAPAAQLPCRRCADCDGALYPPNDTNAVIRHLIEQHGYRMNGTRKEPTP